jgi:hypothetical protein
MKPFDLWAVLSRYAPSYEDLLQNLKRGIRAAQVKAVFAVNRELILLYWHIGREILERQRLAGWGAKVIERLAADLHREFPGMTGFSRTNLLYMRAFAEAWPKESSCDSDETLRQTSPRLSLSIRDASHSRCPGRYYLVRPPRPHYVYGVL